MKNEIATRAMLFLLPFIGIGCGTLNRDANALTINETIESQSRMLIELEDKSGFNVDIQNLSRDTLFLERKGMDNLMIARGGVKAIIQPDAAATITNRSQRPVKLQVKVSGHKAKVRHSFEKLSRDTTAVQ